VKWRCSLFHCLSVFGFFFFFCGFGDVYLHFYCLERRATIRSVAWYYEFGAKRQLDESQLAVKHTRKQDKNEAFSKEKKGGGRGEPEGEEEEWERLTGVQRAQCEALRAGTAGS